MNSKPILSGLGALSAMLIIAGPLMSQGMWHRFPGLIAAIPNNTHNFPLADSYSDNVRKTLRLAREDGRWKIVTEQAN